MGDYDFKTAFVARGWVGLVAFFLAMTSLSGPVYANGDNFCFEYGPGSNFYEELRQSAREARRENDRDAFLEAGFTLRSLNVCCVRQKPEDPAYCACNTPKVPSKHRPPQCS